MYADIHALVFIIYINDLKQLQYKPEYRNITNAVI